MARSVQSWKSLRERGLIGAVLVELERGGGAWWSFWEWGADWSSLGGGVIEVERQGEGG